MAAESGGLVMESRDRQVPPIAFDRELEAPFSGGDQKHYRGKRMGGPNLHH